LYFLSIIKVEKIPKTYLLDIYYVNNFRSYVPYNKPAQKVLVSILFSFIYLSSRMYFKLVILLVLAFVGLTLTLDVSFIQNSVFYYSLRNASSNNKTSHSSNTRCPLDVFKIWIKNCVGFTWIILVCQSHSPWYLLLNDFNLDVGSMWNRVNLCKIKPSVDL